ncbi:MAG: hypothetical protein WCC60_00480 [Ilumatobacteraceae bacterium]
MLIAAERDSSDLDRMIADDDEPAITIAEPGAGVELATGRPKTNRRAFLYDGHGPTLRDSITERGHLRAARPVHPRHQSGGMGQARHEMEVVLDSFGRRGKLGYGRVRLRGHLR